MVGLTKAAGVCCVFTRIGNKRGIQLAVMPNNNRGLRNQDRDKSI